MSLHLLFFLLRFNWNIHKVQKSMLIPISKVDTFPTLVKGINYWMLPGKKTHHGERECLVLMVFCLSGVTCELASAHCLYDALPTFTEINCVHALFFRFYSCL